MRPAWVRGTILPEFDRRLREVSQLRKIWRAFRDPQERLEDERLSRPIVQDHANSTIAFDPITAYGLVAVRAAIRHWWRQKQYEAIATLGNRLDPTALESEPLLHLYIEAARSSRGPSSP